MRSLDIAAIVGSLTLLAAVAAAVFDPPTTAVISVTSSNTAPAVPTREILSAQLDIQSAGDPYLRVSPEGCVFSVVIDGKKLIDPQIPFCQERRGRVLSVPALKESRPTEIDVEVESGTSQRVQFIPERSPWKILCLGLLVLSSLIFGSPKVLAFAVPRLRRFRGVFDVLLSSARSALVILLAVWTLFYFNHGDPRLEYRLGVLGIDCYLVWLLFRARRKRPAEQEVVASASINPVVVRKWSRLALLITSVAVVVIVGLISTIRHYYLESRAFDLAIQENVLWNTITGDPFVSSVMGGIPYLGNHTVVAYVLLLPLYYLLPSTYTLLWFQAAVVVATVMPLFLVARHLLRSERAASLVAISFLLHPALLGASCNDFHELALSPCAIAWLLYAVVFQKPLALAVMTLVCASIKEDMSLNLLVLGGGLLATRYVTQGVYLALCGVASYVLWQGIVIPAFAGFDSSYTWYLAGNLGAKSSPLSIVKQLAEAPFNEVLPLVNRDKLMFLLHTLGAFLLIPCLSLRGAIMTSYGVALVLLSGHAPLYTLGYHYVFAWITAAMFAYLFVTAEVKSSRLRQLSIGAVFVAHGILFALFGPIYPVYTFRSGPIATRMPFVSSTSPEAVAGVEWVKATIPEDASVVTGETFAPHFAKRKRIVARHRVNDTISATFDYCLGLRSNSAITCSHVGCKGTEVPGPHSAVVLCRQ